jgi:3-oxoacyl-(acyl-carrier-protein) synthase
MRRVVITGVGVVAPHGIGTAPFWNALLEGKSSITALTRFDPSAFACQVAGVVPPFKTADYVPRSYRKSTKIMALDIQLAVTAADFAVRDAKLITRGIAEGTPEAEDISVFPMAIPMITGPGSIASAMLWVSRAETPAHIAVVLAAITTVMLITMATLLAAGPLMRLIGEKIEAMITRILGVILAALAAQFIVDGLKQSFPHALG